MTIAEVPTMMTIISLTTITILIIIIMANVVVTILLNAGNGQQFLEKRITGCGKKLEYDPFGSNSFNTISHLQVFPALARLYSAMLITPYKTHPRPFFALTSPVSRSE